MSRRIQAGCLLYTACIHAYTAHNLLLHECTNFFHHRLIFIWPICIPASLISLFTTSETGFTLCPVFVSTQRLATIWSPIFFMNKDTCYLYDIFLWYFHADSLILTLVIVQNFMSTSFVDQKSKKKQPTDVDSYKYSASIVILWLVVTIEFGSMWF